MQNNQKCRQQHPANSLDNRQEEKMQQSIHRGVLPGMQEAAGRGINHTDPSHNKKRLTVSFLSIFSLVRKNVPGEV